MIAQVASLVANCTDPDGMAVLAYLSRHIRRAERLGLRVAFVSDKQLTRDMRYPGATRTASAGVVYRAFTGNNRPWCHISRKAVESAVRRPRELGYLLDFLSDFLVDGHFARTGRILRVSRD